MTELPRSNVTAEQLRVWLVLERRTGGARSRSRDHPIVPALKIARLAVAYSARLRFAGVGTALVQVALAMALYVAQRVGCRLLTVDAYPAAVSFYERLGFMPNRAKPYQGREHPSMRLDVFPPVPHSWDA